MTLERSRRVVRRLMSSFSGFDLSLDRTGFECNFPSVEIAMMLLINGPSSLYPPPPPSPLSPQLNVNACTFVPLHTHIHISFSSSLYIYLCRLRLCVTVLSLPLPSSPSSIPSFTGRPKGHSGTQKDLMHFRSTQTEESKHWHRHFDNHKACCITINLERRIVIWSRSSKSSLISRSLVVVRRVRIHDVMGTSEAEKALQRKYALLAKRKKEQVRCRRRLWHCLNLFSSPWSLIYVSENNSNLIPISSFLFRRSFSFRCPSSSCAL